MSLKPFWCYYGGKWRAAPHYPAPEHNTIVEPFAGAAGYSLRYYQRRVILVEKYEIVAELWRYLISVSSQEIMRIPLVKHIDDLPGWCPRGARILVGFNLNHANVSPCNTLSSGLQKLQSTTSPGAGWSERFRARVASQVDSIRHWRIIEGCYTSAPDIEATWFVDPPYNNKAGSHYKHSNVDYGALGLWCRLRAGQTIVCENDGATWLPFKPFRIQPPSMNKLRRSAEAIWTA